LRIAHGSSGRRRSELGAKKCAHAFATTVQVRTDGIDRHLERGGDGLIAAVLLVVKDEDGAFGLRERKQGRVDGMLELGVGQELLGGAGVPVQVIARHVLEPVGGLIVLNGSRHRGDDLAVAAAALPLVLRYVDDDAVEIGGEGGIAAELRERAVKAEENLLGEVLDVSAGAGHARESPEDHGLVLANQSFKRLR
jgi:hypothetical protein